MMDLPKLNINNTTLLEEYYIEQQENEEEYNFEHDAFLSPSELTLSTQDTQKQFVEQNKMNVKPSKSPQYVSQTDSKKIDDTPVNNIHNSSFDSRLTNPKPVSHHAQDKNQTKKARIASTQQENEKHAHVLPHKEFVPKTQEANKRKVVDFRLQEIRASLTRLSNKVNTYVLHRFTSKTQRKKHQGTATQESSILL